VLIGCDRAIGNVLPMLEHEMRIDCEGNGRGSEQAEATFLAHVEPRAYADIDAMNSYPCEP
jgi:hypothetical protein